MKLTRDCPITFTLDIKANSTHHQSMMLTSDVHFDSSHCDLKRFTEHLKIADQEKAPVLIAGDFFDAMQGHDDPRRSPEELKEQYRVSHYFDAIVLDASHYLRQFENIPLWILAMGNHESKVLEKINTNLLERLAYDMRLHGHNAEAAGYRGYLRVIFRYKNGSDQPSRSLYWYHGISSNAKVTHGVIDVNRQSTWLTDVDVVLNGHNHKSYWMPQPVERRTTTNIPYTDAIHFFRTPGYKMSSGETQSPFGFGSERHPEPTLKGCVFLDMIYRKGHDIPVTLEHRTKIG